MKRDLSTKTIKEPAREIRVCREADVVVVGGGPGGVGAALAGARNGADTVLIERYGHLGGMATGGLVTILPAISDLNGKQQIAGLCQEWIDRLDARGAADHPKKEEWGSSDKKLLSYYENRSDSYVRMHRVIYAVLIDAEISKCILNDMVEEAGVKTYLHSWGTESIMDGNTVKGVIFESKSGRQAVLGKVVIDSTGDGDLLPSAGVEFDSEIDPKLRIANLSLNYWIANVDLKKVEDFKLSQLERHAELMRGVLTLGGQPPYITPYRKSNLMDQDSIVWMQPRYPVSSQIDVEELTRVEFLGRKKMMITFDFFKKHVPGFENCFIVLTDPQLGTRGARRMIGEYMLTEKDIGSDEVFKDTIAILPDNAHGEKSIKHPHFHVPYRSLVPRKVEGLLVACRAYSSDDVVNNFFNYIPHCMALGQAAGTAAAMAVKAGIKPRKVDYSALQERLIKQGVPLPDEVKTRIKA